MQKKISTNPQFLRIIQGALIGDALGGVLEFTYNIDEQKVLKAFKFEGGGMLKLAPFQITDDGELTLSQLYGINEGKNFSLNNIAKYYGKWFRTNPIDIGNTFRVSVPHGNQKEQQANAMRKANQKNPTSIRSKSNGCLMTLTPIACFLSIEKDIRKIDILAREVAQLTHTQEVIHDCAVFYCLMIKFLIEKNNFKNAIKEIENQWLEKYSGKEFQTWYNEIMKDNQPPIQANKHIGFAKIAFQWLMYFLKNDFDWNQAMNKMLLQGGDTDTNCCIISGCMMSSDYIYEKNKKQLQEITDKLMSVDYTKKIKRPEYLRPSGILQSQIENFNQKIEKYYLNGFNDQNVDLDSMSDQGRKNFMELIQLF